MYTEGHTVKGGRKLPLNLLDALRLTDKSKALRSYFGDSFIELLLHDEDDRVELLHPAPDRVGAAEHAGLLTAVGRVGAPVLGPGRLRSGNETFFPAS